jgi:hypothetical protein
VDATEPPRIVFESSAKCAEGGRAADLLRQVLAPARAPGHAWVVTMRVDAATAGELRAEGKITGDGGVEVGHRAFLGKATDCRGLARAIGVWASLVLDGELRRPRSVATVEEGAPAGHEDEAKPRPDAALDAGAKSQPAVAAPPPQPSVTWSSESEPEPAELGEKTSRLEEVRTLEFGVGAFLMTGTGGLMIGATPFVIIEVAKGLFIRPALALGESLPSAQPDMTLMATRLDGCLRVAGLYTAFHGIQLDLCGGVDVGVLDVAGQTSPYVAIGPSMDLRGELGGQLSVILRGLIDVNAVNDVSPEPLAGRGELAMSWRLR